MDLPAPEPRPEPPRLAVALADGPGGPHVVAKGSGALAEAILDLAFAHDVKVREDAALAAMLSQIDLDSPVPAEALEPVCAVLAHVYAATRTREPR